MLRLGTDTTELVGLLPAEVTARIAWREPGSTRGPKDAITRLPSDAVVSDDRFVCDGVELLGRIDQTNAARLRVPTERWLSEWVAEAAARMVEEPSPTIGLIAVELWAAAESRVSSDLQASLLGQAFAAASLAVETLEAMAAGQVDAIGSGAIVWIETGLAAACRFSFVTGADEYAKRLRSAGVPLLRRSGAADGVLDEGLLHSRSTATAALHSIARMLSDGRLLQVAGKRIASRLQALGSMLAWIDASETSFEVPADRQTNPESVIAHRAALLIGSRRSAAVLTSWGDDTPEFCLSLAGNPVLIDWTVAIEIDGQPAVAEGDWRLECEFSDADADYVELARTLRVDPSAEATQSRHIMLAKDDRLLYLADSVRRCDGRAVAMRQNLEVADGRHVQPDPRDRFAWIGSVGVSKTTARLYPLAVKADRLTPSASQFECVPDGSIVSVSTAGRSAVCSPVVIDYGRKRRFQAPVWNPLTVAEYGRRCPTERAAAFRLRCGDGQWMFYHSLVLPVAPRTVLGVHTHFESIFARFVDGKAEPLVNVEA